MSRNESEGREQRLAGVRKLRIRTHRADAKLQEVHSELERVSADAEPFGRLGRKFSGKLNALLADLEKLTTRAALDADQFEQDHYSAEPDRLSAVHLIVEGGDVPEPDAHALGLLLDLVEGGSCEALDFENHISKQAFVWLLRQHPPAVDHIRKLAEIAGEANSDHIKWAGKRIE